MQIYAEAESNANELVQFYHISENIQDIRLRTHDKSSHIDKAQLIMQSQNECNKNLTYPYHIIYQYLTRETKTQRVKYIKKYNGKIWRFVKKLYLCIRLLVLVLLIMWLV